MNTMYNSSYKKFWSKEIVDLLIIKYQEHENLYDVKNPMYEDREKRSNSLFDICKKLRELNNSITVDDIKKKIHTLRTQYIKESREIARMERSTPRLWCYYQLDFLKHHCTKRKCNTNNTNIGNYYKSNMENEATMGMNRQFSIYSRSNNENEFIIDETVRNVEDDISIEIKNEPPDYTRSNVTEIPIDGEHRTNPNNNSDVNNEFVTYPTSNMEGEVSIDLNSECPAYSNSNNKRKKTTSKLVERIDYVKSILIKRLEEKSNYDWLGKQVVFEMNSIKDKKIQRDTAWKIQTILREASIEDTATSKRQSEQLSNQNHLETQTSFASCSSKEQSMCSSLSSPSVALQQSVSQTAVHPVQPVQIISANSYNTNTSYSSEQNILQQPLDGIKEEEEVEYECL